MQRGSNGEFLYEPKPFLYPLRKAFIVSPTVSDSFTGDHKDYDNLPYSISLCPFSMSQAETQAPSPDL